MAFSRIKARIDQSIENAVRTGVTNIAEDAKRNADWSSDIPKAIYVGDVKKVSKGVWEGQVIVDSSKEGPAPQAAAFEYGSGVHGEKGQTYKIEPDKAPVLAFPWSPAFIPWKSSKFAGVIRSGNKGTKGTYFFHEVDHPGVEARPYLRPAIEKNRKSIRTLLLNSFIRGYKDAIDVKVIIK